MRIILQALLCILAEISTVHPYSVGPSVTDTLPDGRIVGGKPATSGQLPYQVGLQLKIENQTRMGTCGGALIDEEYVLTAAHCVVIGGIEYIEVHLGALELKNEKEGHKVVVVPKENFIPHGWWDPSTTGNDIALLKLPEKVALSNEIRPVALPSYSDIYNLDLEDKHVIASGWGRYSDASSEISPFLQFATVRVVNQIVCRHFYPDKLRSSMICTSTGSGQGTCHGDSGGPLVYHDSTTRRIILVGLTSFGNGLCVTAGYPSVFTRITSYLTWIAENSGIEVKDF